MTYGRELEGDVEFVEREEALRPSSRPRPK
jgi:hypothetical protein